LFLDRGFKELSGGFIEEVEWFRGEDKVEWIDVYLEIKWGEEGLFW
jgi:hypothetical protein